MNNNENILVSDIIIKYLLSVGIDKIYGSPGTSELSLVKSASKYGMEYIFVLHDTIGVGMADGNARASNSIAVVNLHATQGLLNSLGFIRVAYRDNTPILIIAGLPSTTYDIYEPNHFTNNLVQIISPVTKWSWVISNPNLTEVILHKSISELMSNPQGPVFIGIPQNILEQSIQIKKVKSKKLLRISSTPYGSAELDYEYVIKLINRSKNPTIFAGYGSKDAIIEIEQLSNIISAPVISESLDRGPQLQGVYCRSNHPLFMGYFDRREIIITNQIKISDLLIFIGSRATYSKIIGKIPYSTFVIEINSNISELGKYHKIDIPMLGNIKSTIETLIYKIIKSSNKLVQNSKKKKIIIKKIEAYRNSKKEKIEDFSKKCNFITGYHLIKSIQSLVPKSSILVDDSQSMGYFIKHYYQFTSPNTLFGSMSSHIGWGLPASLGIKQSKPSELVVSILGDAGFLFSIQALEAASSYNIPVLIIVVNNKGFISLKKEMDDKWGLSDNDNRILSLKNPHLDYSKLANSLGVESTEVSKTCDLDMGIKKGLDTVIYKNIPFLLNVKMSESLKDWNDSWYTTKTNE